MNLLYLKDLIKILKDKSGNFNSQKIKNNQNIIEIINNIEELNDFSSILEKLFAIENSLLFRPTCVCGQFTKYNKSFKKYNLYCSNNCPQSLEIRQQNRVRTNLERYGVENTSSLKEVREKIENTFISNYGVKNPSQSELILNKRKLTNLDRYGYESAMSSPKVREKIKRTNLERYNSEIYFASEDAKTKIKNSFKNSFIKTKLIEKLKLLSDTFNIVPTWDPSEYINKEAKYEFKHLDCGKVFISSFDDGNIPKCPKCHFIRGESKIEIKLRNDLLQIFGKELIDYSNRNLINPYELDIIINNKIAVEVNGTYWHREDNSNISILDKTNMCPIPILHFWDFELENKYEICLSIILNKNNFTPNKIYARKCEVRKIESKIANNFLDKNHLSGRSNGRLNYGLYHNDELVLLISLGKSRFSKKYDYEIHRIASKLNTQITGGVSKLFKHIKKDIGNVSIVTYADKRYSNGNIYKKLGFKELEDSQPNYLWVSNNTILNRYKTQKHKLSRILKKFDQNLTESENMILNGYYKIKDCGNKVFILND